MISEQLLPEVSWRILHGDALSMLATLEAATVQACVTSPPYWGHRDYGADGQLGLEPTPEEYVAKLVAVFREVRRVLRDDGTLWLNLGDSYAANRPYQVRETKGTAGHTYSAGASCPEGMKPKDLIGIPWMVAFALRADGWYLRSDIIWAKPNPMPESVTDRPTRAHEYVFLLSKAPRYFYDSAAIREDFADECLGRDGAVAASERNRGGRSDGFTKPNGIDPSANGGRNRRSVWTIATQPYPGAHFATFPLKLIEPCILAGSRPDDIVLDPFAGAGTTGLVALRHDRDFIGIELNAEYVRLAERRIEDDAPLFNSNSHGVDQRVAHAKQHPPPHLPFGMLEVRERSETGDTPFGGPA